MGIAFSRISIDGLKELMKLPDSVELLQVMPPGFSDMTKRHIILMLESPEFPPSVPGMMVPEVHIVYETHKNGFRFKTLEFVNERRELPPPEVEGSYDPRV